MAFKFCYNLDLRVIYVDKHSIYPVCILMFLILLNIHGWTYIAYIHSKRTYIKLLSNLKIVVCSF